MHIPNKKCTFAADLVPKDILHTCWQLFDSVKSGKLHKESRIISHGRFVSCGGCGPLLLILTHGLPEPHRKNGKGWFRVLPSSQESGTTEKAETR